MEPPTQVEFQGRTYIRYPDAKKRNHRLYYSSHSTFKGTPLLLHREIWKSVHGEIPKGHHIHHRDGDTFNNHIDNLVCVTVAEHRRMDAERGAYSTKKVFDNLNRIRHLAAEWHGTEEGIAWHRENGKKAFAKREAITLTCLGCEQPYQTKYLSKRAKYCSTKCSQKHRRQIGELNVTKMCPECGKEFTTRKYQVAKACSRTCREALNKKTKGIV